MSDAIRPFKFVYRGPKPTFRVPDELLGRLDDAFARMMKQTEDAAHAYLSAMEEWLKRTMADAGLTLEDIDRCLLETSDVDYVRDGGDRWTAHRAHLKIDGVRTGTEFIWTVLYRMGDL